MAKMVDRVCEKCGVTFSCRLTYVKMGWGKFCSRLCNQKNNGDNNNSICFKSGDKNPAWKGGEDVRKQEHRERVKKYKNDNKIKIIAHRKLALALKNNKLKKTECFTCGAEEVEAHHADYSMPLDVIWLCRKHHLQTHREHKKHPATIT